MSVNLSCVQVPVLPKDQSTSCHGLPPRTSWLWPLHSQSVHGWPCCHGVNPSYHVGQWPRHPQSVHFGLAATMSLTSHPVGLLPRQYWEPADQWGSRWLLSMAFNSGLQGSSNWTIYLFAMNVPLRHRPAPLHHCCLVFGPHYDASNDPLSLPPTIARTGLPNTLRDQTKTILIYHYPSHPLLIPSWLIWASLPRYHWVIEILLPYNITSTPWSTLCYWFTKNKWISLNSQNYNPNSQHCH